MSPLRVAARPHRCGEPSAKKNLAHSRGPRNLHRRELAPRFYCSLRAVKVVLRIRSASTYDRARSHAEGLYRFTSKSSCRSQEAGSRLFRESVTEGARDLRFHSFQLVFRHAPAFGPFDHVIEQDLPLATPPARRNGLSSDGALGF